jgi:hypothetical protein
VTVIELRPHEVRHAMEVGYERNLVARSQRRRPLIAGSNTFQGDITGALGELVVAKALGVHWEPNVGGNDHGKGDVGAFEVRATARTPARLTIRDRDDDAACFVLVTGVPPCLSIAGWLYAGDAKRPEYLDRRSYQDEPTWQVPAERLQPWDERPWIDNRKEPF